MKQILYTLFGYRFLYLGLSTRNPGRIKIGIARNVKLRWRSIGRSMKGWQFPIFSLPCFGALWVEQHLHRVMRRYNRPVRGDGGSEFFTYTNPLSWPGWLYVLCAITCAFLLTHLALYLFFSWLWCLYAEVDFLVFQREVLSVVKDGIRRIALSRA